MRPSAGVLQAYPELRLSQPSATIATGTVQNYYTKLSLERIAIAKPYPWCTVPTAAKLVFCKAYEKLIHSASGQRTVIASLEKVKFYVPGCAVFSPLSPRYQDLELEARIVSDLAAVGTNAAGRHKTYLAKGLSDAAIYVVWTNPRA